MTALSVAAAPPQSTPEQLLANIRRLAPRPTKIRFSPAIAPDVAVALRDGDERIIVCSWTNRDAVRAALLANPDSRFQLDESSVA